MNLADQLSLLVKAVERKAAPTRSPDEDRADRTLAYMRSVGTVTPAGVAKALNIHLTLAQRALRALRARGEVVSWRSGNATHYGVKR